MNIEEQIAFYDKRWQGQEFLNSLKLRRAIKILEYFSIVKRRLKRPRILDLGCGDGRFTSFLGEFGPTHGIELSKEAVRMAQEKYPNVLFFQGNVLEYPFMSKNYDVVVSQEVLEHIEDQAAYLNVCSHVLMDGGYLILTTPNKRVFDHLEGGNWSNQPIEKVLTPRQLKELISHDFKILKYESIIMNFGNLGYFKWINSKYLIGICNRLGLQGLREKWLSTCGYGLHQCILAQKK